MSTEHSGIASPAPAGLVALAVACFTFFAILSGNVGHTAIPLLACWLIGGFVIQIVVAVIELKEGNLLGGNVFLFFSAFFMLVGGLEFIVKAYFGTVHGNPIDARIDGWAWLPLLITLIMWTFAYLKKAPMVMGLLVLLLDVGVFFITFIDLGLLPKSLSPVCAYFILGGGFCALYVSSAIILNTTFGRTILPMPGPILSSAYGAPVLPVPSPATK
ncbi:MAG: GPR1/FUN34/YaaH family transporter [Pseudomonadota bacterium]